LQKTYKKETIEEYLARGGKITICPPQSSDPEENKLVKSTSKAPQEILDLGTGEIIYGEKIKKTRKKAKKTPSMAADQVDLLPDSLKHLANRGNDVK
jgi:hypothetical protein